MTALTTRQRQVITLIAAGCTNDQIAGHLGIGLSTVKTHIKLAMRVLGAANRWQALRLAREAGELW